MPIAKLSRDALRQVATDRLEESSILLHNKQWTGAYYMAGLSVECALKSVLASRVKEFDYPDLRFVRDMYSHELDSLLMLDAVLWQALQSEIKMNQKLAVNWSTVKDWDNEKRYEILQESQARDMYEAVSEPVSGVMDWIRGKW